MNEIKYPKLRTYFIAYNDVNEFSHGYVDPEQCMGTGLEKMETFTDRDAWAKRILDFGVPDEELSE